MCVLCLGSVLFLVAVLLFLMSVGRYSIVTCDVVLCLMLFLDSRLTVRPVLVPVQQNRLEATVVPVRS